MGWLGWTEEAALSADINAIEVAMRGRVAMLRAIFGRADDEPSTAAAKPVSSRPMTPELFKALWG